MKKLNGIITAFHTVMGITNYIALQYLPGKRLPRSHARPGPEYIWLNTGIACSRAERKGSPQHEKDSCMSTTSHRSK